MKHLSIELKVAALAALLVLAGCASSGGATKSEKAAPAPVATAAPAKQATTPAAAATNAGGATGKVVFFRESKFAGAAVSFKVREGAQELGKLSSGTYFVATLPAGAHTFTVHSEAKDVLNLEVEPGETYYVQGTVSMGFMVGRPNLRRRRPRRSIR